MHPRAHVVVCIDERSLAFWALGYGKAKRCTPPPLTVHRLTWSILVCKLVALVSSLTQGLLRSFKR